MVEGARSASSEKVTSILLGKFAKEVRLLTSGGLDQAATSKGVDVNCLEVAGAWFLSKILQYAVR